MAKRLVACFFLFTCLSMVAPFYAGVASAEPHRTISWGARGSDVRDAQRRLRDWGYYKGAVDGVFGAKMSAAVKSFQRKNGLRADGVVGPATWRALGVTIAGGGGRPAPARKRTPARGGNARGANVDLLARLVRAEAEAEPYEGKVAVAAVMLNRVRDSRFPNTLEGVVYEPHAFESVSNGRIYQTPPTSQDLKAARDALNGWDPTYGSVFFWNPSKPVTPWIWSRPIVKKIGAHVFAK